MKRNVTAHNLESGLNTKEFHLRPLKRKELSRFIELGFPTCIFLHGRENISKSFQKQQFRSFVNQHAFEEGSEIHILADDSDQIAGQLWLHTTINRFNGQKELWVWDITIDKPHQGCGLGKRLMEFARQRAAELNCEELWLLVADDNFSARRFYEDFGMVDAGRVMKMTIGAEENSISASESTTSTNTEGIIIRPLIPEDIGPMLQLWRDADLEHRPTGRDTPERIRAEIRSIPDLIIGAFDNGKIIGSVLGTTDGRRGWINRLVVHPDYRRKGLAKKLMDACEKSLRARGLGIFTVLVHDENLPSVKLLESCDYLLYHGILYYTKRDRKDI